MANYNVQISWSGKDALPDSDPAKVISGADFQTEFDAVKAAINSKAELSAILSAIYPVGSIYTNATNSTNPATLLGFGTWTAFGTGRVPVGYDASNSNFNAAEKTGGSADAIVVSHTHTGTTDNGGVSGTFGVGAGSQFPTQSNARVSGGFSISNTLTSSTFDDSSGSYPTFKQFDYNGTHTHSFTTNSAGSSGTDANLQPYITVYMWKRTA